MDKETEQFMLAQFLDVLEMYESFSTIEEVHEYTKKQLENVNSQLKKEPSVTSDQTSK